jgi:hypothetical protein
LGQATVSELPVTELSAATVSELPITELSVAELSAAVSLGDFLPRSNTAPTSAAGANRKKVRIVEVT